MMKLLNSAGVKGNNTYSFKVFFKLHFSLFLQVHKMISLTDLYTTRITVRGFSNPNSIY